MIFGGEGHPTDSPEPPSEHAPDAHERLGLHLSRLGMGFPGRPELIDILRRLFSPKEAETALLLPTAVAPLEVATVGQISKAAGRADSLEALTLALERLVQRGLVFAGPTRTGERGYALLQVGFGFPQTFFWDSGTSPEAPAMAELVIRYFNREVTREAYAATPTKPYRYVPVGVSLQNEVQAVLPGHAMRSVIEGAERFALAHCPCRVALRLRGRPCEHPEDVCMKFDDLADYLVERGLGREIDREEAWDVVVRSEAAGLVHFVDNAEGAVKHNCNCCGCACWNVGSIRRRKIPRDDLMATYFLRTTDLETCTGCGRCVAACPVDALALGDAAVAAGQTMTPVARRGPGSEPSNRVRDRKVAVVDDSWCIGCGVCVARCPTGAARLQPRADVPLELAPDFATLHRRILDERGLSG